MANRKEAGAVNSRNYLGLGPWGKVLVVQITGLSLVMYAGRKKETC